MSNDVASDSSSAAPAETSATAQQPPEPVPAGISFKTRIVTPIDSDTAAAGDPIEAVLRSAIRGKKHAPLAPVGARLHGRLRRFERASTPLHHFEVVVQLESVEIGGKSVPLFATSDPPRPRGPSVDRIDLTASQGRDPWDSSIFYFSQTHLRLTELDSEWITVSADEVQKVTDAARKKK